MKRHLFEWKESKAGSITSRIILTTVATLAFILTLFFIMQMKGFKTFTTITPFNVTNSQEKFTSENEIIRSAITVHRKKHFANTYRRLPQALIIGVRKCGTRALLEMLFLHPRIQKAAGEVHFFDRDDNYNKGLEWYRKKMPYSFMDQVTIEKSPSYFVTPEVPERVHAMNSSIKLLLILREPVTRAISDYTQLRSHAFSDDRQNTTSSTPHRKSLKTFEQLVLTSNGEINYKYRPIAISIYHTFVHQWLQVFSRDQILIVNGDRLIEDPFSEIKKIELFLGLHPKIEKHNFQFNTTKGFYCLKSNTNERCLRGSKGRKHPHVDSKVIEKLRRFFSEHNQKLYELIDEDLGWPEN